MSLAAMLDRDVTAQLHALESELHLLATRRHRARMHELLHPEFEEFGRSGERCPQPSYAALVGVDTRRLTMAAALSSGHAGGGAILNPSTPWRASLLALAAASSVVVGSAARSATAVVEPRAENQAMSLLRELVAGDVKQYERVAAPKMLQALKPEQLKAVFTDLARQCGPFVRFGAPQSQARDDFLLVEVLLEYERAAQTARVVLDAKGRLVGLQVNPRSDPAAFQSAPYVDAEKFSDLEVVIDAGGWPLPATLSVPKGPGPFAAVVLVHGSGPQDRDSSIGPNRMFRDIAEGLASRSIAVLRYEKRSRAHANRMGELRNLTPKDEVIDDAHAAVRLLRSRRDVLGSAIFVAGHSFGGMLAPAIAREDGSLAGIVILAGPTQPIEDTIVTQARYLAQLDGSVSDVEANQIKQFEDLARQVRALHEPSDPPPRVPPFIAPTSYWLALRSLAPQTTAKALALPVLVLQGERDYQVTMTDFAAWKSILADDPRASFRSFPGLNHAFMPGQGPSSPAEYSIPNHVDAAVIDALSQWITLTATPAAAASAPATH